MKALDLCTSMFGTIGPEYRKRIEKYINTAQPTSDQWDEVAHTIIDGSGRMATVWNAVLELNPLFPHYGRTTDQKGKMLKDWEAVPSGFEVARAIQNHFKIHLTRAERDSLEVGDENKVD